MHCKVLQTKEREERRSKDYRECDRGFFPRQGVSTDSPTFVNSKVRLLDKAMKDFLDYFGARKYETNKGYSVEWVTKKIQWSSKEEAIGILKVWTHSSRAKECTEEKIKELNEITDNEVLLALKALCYESPKKEQVSHVFKHLIANIKLYNVDKI